MSFNFHPLSSGRSNALSLSAPPRSFAASRLAAGGTIVRFPIDPSNDTPPPAGPSAALPSRVRVIEMIEGCEIEMQRVQSRVGTCHETPDDAQTAWELANQSQNLRLALELWDQIMARRAVAAAEIALTRRSAAA